MIEERTAELHRVHERIFGGKARAAGRPAPAPLSDAEIFRRARRGKSGAKFAALYDRGDWEGQGYPSQSEADLALCGLLSRACDGEAARVDVLFRRSALMRTKWDDPHFADGRTYGQETLNKAVQMHSGSRGRAAKPSGFKARSAATEARAGRMCTDTGNAERFVRMCGELIRYCHVWKSFLCWDKRRWRLDDRGMPMRYSKQVVRSIYDEARDCQDPDEKQRLASWAVSSEKIDRRKALVELAKSEKEIVVAPDDLDPDSMLLNCSNGTLDLRTLQLRPHSKSDLITKICPVAYEPEAKAPTWEAFLERVLPDQAIRDFVQRAVGWSLTDNISEQVLFFLFGAGANGKSVFLSTILRVLGIDYAIQAAPDLVLSKRQSSHPTDVADLFGKRFVSTVEVGAERAFDEVLIKQLTGGDRIRARRMREDFWEFSPTHHLWIAGNHKPLIRGTEQAIWRRILVVPFTVTIPQAERDKKLAHRLEQELPGILAWMVRGCRAWQKRGIDAPSEVLLATEEYRTEMNNVGRFVDECCVRISGARTRAGTLFHSFARWCEGVAEPLRTQTFFGEAMSELGIRRLKSGGVT
ncbi:MAG: phage/plasmid primase, P4 family, partial [Planctomycetota bacterium]